MYGHTTDAAAARNPTTGAASLMSAMSSTKTARAVHITTAGTSGAAAASASPAGRGRWHGEQSHAAQRRTFRCPRWGGIGRRFRHLLKPALLRSSGRHRRCSGARLDSISARRVCTARFRAIANMKMWVRYTYIARAWNCPLPLATMGARPVTGQGPHLDAGPPALHHPALRLRYEY